MLDLPQLRQVCQALGLTLRELVDRYENAPGRAGHLRGLEITESAEHCDISGRCYCEYLQSSV